MEDRLLMVLMPPNFFPNDVNYAVAGKNRFDTQMEIKYYTPTTDVGVDK